MSSVEDTGVAWPYSGRCVADDNFKAGQVRDSHTADPLRILPLRTSGSSRRR